MTEYIIKVNPCPKPRATQRDKWAPSKAVQKYHGFRTELLIRARLEGITDLPAAVGFIFEIPMPPSWSNAKRDRMRGQVHQQKPDLDNLIKAVKDAFTYKRHVDDSYVSTYLFAQKVWADEGRIRLIETAPESKTIGEALMDLIIKIFTRAGILNG
jgi:Holliday junction resolvase RusA-like endonuclease